MNTFGVRLKQLRKDNGMTQDEVVSVLEKNFNASISASMLSKWENDKEEPASFQNVCALAKLYGVTTDYLICLSDSKYGNEIPLKRIPVLGRIAAGTPITCQEDILGHEYVPEGDKATFALIVSGNSMIGARIYDKDIVFIRYQNDIENGEIAAVLVDGEVTLKRVYKRGTSVELRSENPTIPPMLFSLKDHNVKILGKALGCKFKVV